MSKYLIIVFIFLLLFSCKKDLTRVGYVKTGAVTISDTVLIAVGEIIDVGEGINNHGHCWSPKQMPSILDNHTSLGPSGPVLNYTSVITGTDQYNQLYIRSYIETENDVIYGEMVTFFNTKPEIEILTISQKNDDSLLITCKFLLENIIDSTKSGVCWGENINPTIENNNLFSYETHDDTTINFSITSFKEDQQYHFRAYVENKNGIYYSEDSVFKTGKLIYYNSFNTIEKISGESGFPAIIQLNYNTAPWGVAFLQPAVSGNGLYINHEMDEGYGNIDSANFFAINTQEISFSSEKGSISFYFIFDFDHDSSNQAYFFNMSSEDVPHYDKTIYHDDLYLSAGWNGWEHDAFEQEKHFFFTIYDPETGKKGNVKLNQSHKIFGHFTSFNAGDTLHFGFVWDNSGIVNTNETMSIYINNKKVASGNFHWNNTLQPEQYLFLGTRPGENNRNYFYNAIKGIMDELYIHNYAKTSF